MDDIALLEGILAKTATVLDGVGQDQWNQPTPCPAYDVDDLVNHIVGWVQVFEAGSSGGQFDGDPTAYRHGNDPGAEFRTAADGLVAGWRDHGLDREVSLTGGGKSPGPMVLNMTL